MKAIFASDPFPGESSQVAVAFSRRIAPSSPQAWRGFTLIELMLTMAIVSILAAISISSLQGMSKLTDSGNRFADMVMLAKQAALSKNTITAIVLTLKPDDSPALSQQAMVLEFDGDANAWKPLGSWVFFPNTVKVVDNSADTTALTNLAAVTLTAAGQTISSYTAFVFYPDGRMANKNSTRQVNINVARGQSPDYYDLVLNSDTSAFQIVRP